MPLAPLGASGILLRSRRPARLGAFLRAAGWSRVRHQSKTESKRRKGTKTDGDLGFTFRVVRLFLENPFVSAGIFPSSQNWMVWLT